jgi:hypothetical protein
LAYFQVIQLACCAPGVIVSGINELIDLELLANGLKMNAVQEMLEAEVLSRLTVATCSIALSRKFLQTTREHGSRGVWEASLALARSDFESFACTKLFVSVPEAVLAEILASDDLQASCEEALFLAVTKWMKEDKVGTLRGEDLLSYIRFPQMGPAFLNAALSHLPTSEKLPALVAEAIALQTMLPDERNKLELQHLDPQCILPRKQVGK